MQPSTRVRSQRKKGRGTPPQRILALAEAQLLRPILDSVVDGIVVTDLEGRFLLFNEAARRILGLGSAAVGPEGWTSTYGLFLPDATTPYPSEELPLFRAIRGESLTDVEIFVRNPQVPEGTWISVNATPWRNEAGDLQGGVAVFRDITARKRADEELQRLSSAVEQTADSVVITDREGTILYVNPAFERTTGFTRDETLGRTPRLLKSGRQDPEFYAAMWETVLAGRVFRGMLVNRKKSGELYHAEQTITPMRDSSGAIMHFVSVWKDITELKRNEERDIEIRLARRVQERLYPRHAPRVAGLDVAGAARPSAMMCGDYFDYIEMPGGRLGIVIGDVSGHGIGPALVMAETRACLRSFSQTHEDLDDILDRVNATLMDDLERNHFVTMLLASVDVGARSMTYANAGHPTGYVLDRSGGIRHMMESTRVPLGVMTDVRGAPHRSLAIEPGDILVFLTDGILESRAPDGRFFGAEEALALIRSHRHEPAERIIEHLYGGVRAFLQNGPQEDDVTVVICKVDA